MKSERYTHLLQGSTVLGMAALLIPVNQMLLGIPFSVTPFLLPPVTILLVFLGYGMQSLYALFLGKRSATDSLSTGDVHTFNRFHRTHAIVPITLALVISGLLFWFAYTVLPEYLYEVYLEQLYNRNTMVVLLLGENSLLPYLVAILAFCTQLAGIVLWFYPPVRLVSISTIVWVLSIAFLEFLLFFYTGGTATQPYGMAIVCFSMFLIAVCLILLYNQGNLEQSYRGSVVSYFEGEERKYNLFLVLILLAALVVLFGLTYVVLHGLWTVVTSILWFILYRILFAGAADGSSKQYEYIAMAEAHGKKLRENSDGYYVGLFIGIAAIAAIVVIAVKTGWLKRIWKQFYQWLWETFGAFLQKRNPVGHPEPEDYRHQNYVDEKRRTQNAFIRDYSLMAERIDDYREFTAALSRLPDASAQLCFAYAVLVRMYEKGNVNLKRSDTPREVQYKVLRAVSGEEIKPITAAFEKIRYEEGEVPLEEAAAILASMCEIIHRYMV